MGSFRESGLKSSPPFEKGGREGFLNRNFEKLKQYNFVGLVKSLKMGYSVIPVKTGIQSFQYLGRFWIPVCAGMTTFYETINF